jgi:hypothetical protein
MKIVSEIILLSLLTFVVEGVVINCLFRTVKWEILGDVYECRSVTEVPENSTFIEEVRGNHQIGKNNIDVEAFFESSNQFQFIPSNFVNIFPKLKAVLFNSPLFRVIASDLKPFPNLLWFRSHSGKFISIDGDLFQHTKVIQRIDFYDGQLANVGKNLLNGLNNLTRVDFITPCLQFYANTPQRIEELKQKLLIQCSQVEETTTTMSTTTECSFRCSLGEEFDTMLAKQDVINAELRQSNDELRKSIVALAATDRRQEERLVELEMMIREITARP